MDYADFLASMTISASNSTARTHARAPIPLVFPADRVTKLETEFRNCGTRIKKKRGGAFGMGVGVERVEALGWSQNPTSTGSRSWNDQWGIPKIQKETISRRLSWVFMSNSGTRGKLRTGCAVEYPIVDGGQSLCSRRTNFGKIVFVYRD